MWSRQGLCAALLAACLAGPAGAQIEDSALGQVDPWGLGFLEQSDTPFQTAMWRGARTEDLLPMLREVRTKGLTPAERALLRRMVLSPALAPAGEEKDEMLAERARIAFELGEASAAAALMGRLETPPPGLDPAETAADLNLAMGNQATACAGVGQDGHDSAYWAKLRAVCAALAGNTSGAELAIEMARSQGVEDSWLLNAVFAASGEMPNPPTAKFDSGIDLAMSFRANLAAPAKGGDPGRPDVAAAMARQKLTPPVLRVKAANIAAAAGLLTADEHRTAYNSALAADGYVQATALDKAYFTSADAFRETPEKAAALAAALKDASGDAARFAAISRLLAPDLARLQVEPDTAPFALTFARACIAAGNAREANRWTSAIKLEESGLPAFETAWIDALVVLAGSNTGNRSVAAVTERLMETAKTASEKRAAARVMMLWSAFYTTAPSDGRAFIAKESEAPGKALAPGKVMSVLAATRSGATAETILSTLELTAGDPSKFDPADLAILVEALRRVGAEDLARTLALEATGYWKTQK